MPGPRTALLAAALSLAIVPATAQVGAADSSSSHPQASPSDTAAGIAVPRVQDDTPHALRAFSPAPSMMPPALWAPAPPRHPDWDVFATFSQGFTHYRASALNEVLVLLEAITRERAGFNHYDVKGFDGHPQNTVSLGVAWKDWRLAADFEFWTETFEQTEVPFEIEANNRGERITCDDLRNRAASLTGLAGCVKANERFFFLPVTLQLSWMPSVTRWLRLGGGYGAGLLGGSATVDFSSTYFGPGAPAPDKVRFTVVPTPLLTPVHKFFVAAEAFPHPLVSFEARGGWRITRLKGLELGELEGNSSVFNTVFLTPQEGDRLYIEGERLHPENRAIFIGSPTEADARASRYDLDQVDGDFDGWFAALQLNFYWNGRKR